MAAVGTFLEWVFHQPSIRKPQAMNEKINDSDVLAAVNLIAARVHHDVRAGNLMQLPEEVAKAYAAIQRARVLIAEQQALQGPDEHR